MVWHDSLGDLSKLMTITKVAHPYRNVCLKRSVWYDNAFQTQAAQTDPSTFSEAKVTRAPGHLDVLRTGTQDLHKPPLGIKKQSREVGLCVRSTAKYHPALLWVYGLS